MIIFRTFLGIFSLIFTIWFSIPIFTNHIINIGNATCIFIFTCLFIYSILFKYINKFIFKLWHPLAGKICLSLLSIGIVVIMIFSVVITCHIVYASHISPDENATVVILGCKVKGSNPSLMLKERLDAAYKYLTDHPGSNAVLSGGKGDNEDISEALCMFNYLTDKGISSKRLYIEDKSTSTRENLEFSLEIINNNQLNNSIAIVSNEFHLYRATAIADSYDISYGTIKASTAWWLFPTYYARELFGVMYQWFL